MKKITAFFLALFPLIVIVLLFVSGLIVKDLNHVFVSSIEFTEEKWEEKYETITESGYPENLTHQFHVNVLPFNATNPEVYYISSDESVATIDDNGLLTVKDFGEAEIMAVAQENHSITATCPIRIYDNKIHRIDIMNEADVSYLGYHESVHVDAQPIPFDDLNDGIDPTVYFDPITTSDIELTEDGQLTSLRSETTTVGTQIHCHINKVEGIQPRIENNKTTVNIGPGVTGIAFKNPSNVFTKEDEINLFNDEKLNEGIITYPDTDAVKEGRIKASDFEYTTEADDDVVEISDDGVVKFKKPGEADIEVIYKKNTSLELKKKITSSCLHASDVAFNRYNFVDNIKNYVPGGGEKMYIDPEDINWNVFPSDYDVSNVKIAAEPEGVIEITGNNKLKVVGSGYTTLTATAQLDETTTKIDNCVVHITDNFDPEDIFLKPSVIWSDSFIYPLRNNLDINNLPTENTKVEWSVNSGAIEYINEDALKYGMLVLNHKYDFEPFDVTATFTDINGTQKYSSSFTFTLDSSLSDKVTQIRVGDGQKVNLVAGQRYQFVDQNDKMFYPLVEYIDTQHDFDLDDQEGYCTFMPYWGFNCGEMYLSHERLVLIGDISINIVVEQEAIGIIADENYPYFTTSSQSVVLSSLPQPGATVGPGYIDVYPRTATKPDGSRYMLDFKFGFEEDDTCQVFQDANSCRIDFKKAGYVNITASLGTNDTKSYLLKSTYGKIGKFALEDETGELIQSGDEIELSPGAGKVSSRTLKVSETFLSDSFESYVGMFDDIECSSGDCSCDVTYDEENPRNVTFTIGISERGRYGRDTIKINAGGFIYYLNVNITEPDIKGFDLYYRGQKLKKGQEESDINTSYVNHLELTVQPLPIISDMSCQYSIDDGNPVLLEGHEINTGALSQGLHTIKLMSDNNFEQIFQFNIADVTSITDFEIKEAQSNDIESQKNMVYFNCCKKQCALTVQIRDAIFDESIMTHFEFEGFIKKQDEKVIKNERSHRFVISNIPSATDDEPSYDNKITIVLNKQSSPLKKTYTLKRDDVSRIVLPNHDNLKQSDQKGLQKVHVFGNQSMYPGDEHPTEGYRLPIEIYDYRNRKIDGKHYPDKKEEAFESLKIRMWSAHHAYLPTDCKYDKEHDCVLVKFYKDDLYTPEEMYDNAFEQGYKNVTLSISTNSGLANAQYTFVPVEGVNVYCKEAIATNRSLVLQSNIGLEGATKDNIEIESQALSRLFVGNLYGNGYIFNCHKFHEKLIGENFQIQPYAAFNVTLQGCNDGEMGRYGKSATRCQNSEDGGPPYRMVAYNIYKNWPAGYECYYKERQVKNKNCLFYNNLFTSININGSVDGLLDVYIENCILFNCSSVAISGDNNGSVYFKGFFDVYNFRNRDVLENVVGRNLTFLWDIVAPYIRAIGGMQMGADGREYVNSYFGSVGPSPYFWDEETQTYKSGDHGLPGGNPHMTKLISLEPFGYGDVALWGSLNASHDASAPSYYDEFDEHGNLRWYFMNNQLDKITRQTMSRLCMLLAY